MTRVAFTVLAFGIYMTGQGLLLLLAPNLLLGFVGIAPTSETWVRVLGIAVLVLGYYYIRNALIGQREFFRLSVDGRVLQFFLFGGLVFFADAPPVLLAFAGFEFACGIWTFAALRAE